MSPDPGPDRDPRRELSRFRTMVLHDAALRAFLSEIETPALFAERAALAASARGVGLTSDELEALGRDRQAPPPLIEDLEPGPGWLPAQIAEHAVEWTYFGSAPLAEPFYEDSLRAASQRPFNRLFRFRTPLAELERWSTDLPALRPSGLIFHMSRCGSTLAAQMLASLERTVVVSEAPPIDQALRIGRALEPPARIALLRAAVGALGQVRRPGQDRYVIKLDAWHALDLPVFRQAFPDTPWVFLYRDPVEVLVSQARQRGMQLTPSFVEPPFYGLDLPGGVADEDYWARVLAVICAAALRQHPDGGGLLVNYRQLPQALETKILPHFAIAGAAEDRAAMARTALIDAKAPHFAFSPDSALKQQASTPAIREASRRHLAPLYRRLEDLAQA